MLRRGWAIAVSRRRSDASGAAFSSLRRRHSEGSTNGDSIGGGGGSSWVSLLTPGVGAGIRPGISVTPDSPGGLIDGEAAGGSAGAGTPDDRAGCREGIRCRASAGGAGVPVRGDGRARSGSGVGSSRSTGLECDVSASRTAVGCIVHRVSVEAATAAVVATSASRTAEKSVPPGRHADLSHFIAVEINARTARKIDQLFARDNDLREWSARFAR